MKKNTFALLVLVLLLAAALPGLAAAAGYDESFNSTSVFTNTTVASNSMASYTNKTPAIAIRNFDKIGIPTRFFWNSNNAFSNNWMNVVDVANETKSAPITFLDQTGLIPFGQGTIYYQINYVYGTTTPKSLSYWIDVSSWDPSLIGNPIGTYIVRTSLDTEAFNGCYPGKTAASTWASHFAGTYAWNWAQQGTSLVCEAGTSANAYWVLSSVRDWNSYLQVDFHQGYSDVQVFRNSYNSGVKINSSILTYHDSYSSIDLTGGYAVRVFESPFTFNITDPYGVSRLRTLFNPGTTEQDQYLLQLDKSSVQLFENVTGTLSFLGTGSDPADQIEYQTPGAIVRDSFKKIGSNWYHFNLVTQNWDLTTAADAYTGTINFPSSSFHEGESRTFDCYVHQGETVLQEFHIPITLTSSAGWVTISFEARDLATGYLIPYTNLNLTLRSSGVNTQYNLGVTGKKYITLPRNSDYGFNITSSDYNYPVIRNLAGTIIPHYGLYTDTDKECVAYLTRTLSAGTNKTNVIFKVTDGLTGWDRPGAWVTLKDQNEVALSVAQTNDYGIYTFLGLDCNRTYRYSVDSAGWSPAGGSFNAGANQSYTVNVVMYQVPATTLPAGVTTIPTATPDYQNSQEARDAAVWSGLNFVYGNIGLFMQLGFIVALVSLVGMLSGKRRRG